MYAEDGKTKIDTREYLKVKVKDLTEEARNIRREERKSHGVIREGMHRHRVVDIRRAARSTHLAYGFIRGRSLEQMEKVSYTQPDWKVVRKMIEKYGPTDFQYPECFPALAVNRSKVGERGTTEEVAA